MRYIEGAKWAGPKVETEIKEEVIRKNERKC